MEHSCVAELSAEHAASVPDIGHRSAVQAWLVPELSTRYATLAPDMAETHTRAPYQMHFAGTNSGIGA
eukprot:3496033-Rhodomonas_salina.1